MVLDEDSLFRAPLTVAFVESGQGFIPVDGPLRRGQGPQPSPRVYTAFHTPRLLCDDMRDLLARAEQAGLRAGAVLRERVAGPGVGGVCVDGDDPRGGRMARPKRWADTSVGRLGVPGCAQQTVEAVTRGIDGPVVVIPPLLDLARRLIDTLGVGGRLPPRSTPFLQRRCSALAPTQHGRMIDRDASFPPAFVPITSAHRRRRDQRTAPRRIGA
jgi:hypothetical protein